MEALTIIVQLSAIVFVLASMLAMGLSLTVPQIIEPLKDLKLVTLALLVNFVAVPLLLVGIQAVLKLDEDIFTGLVLMATAAGAPFLPKLAQAAKGNLAFSVGLMTMLMVVTVVYMPIVLPLFLTGVTVNPWDIARSLIAALLIPLGIGLLVKARWESIAEGLEPLMTQASSVAVLLLLAGAVVLQWENIVSLFGTRGILAIIIFAIVSLLLGFFAGGSDQSIRSVMGLGTAQRNLSAALVVGAQNFSDRPTVLVTVIVAGIILLLILLPAAGEMGRRVEVSAEAGEAS